MILLMRFRQRPSMRFAFHAIAACFLISCGSPAPGTRDNFAHLYGKESNLLRTQLRVYHTAQDRSVLYFKLRTKDLLYKSPGNGQPYVARVLVSYEAFNDWGGRQLLDSGSVQVRDEVARIGQEKELIGSIPLGATSGADFVLKVTAHDVNRDLQSTVMLRVERGDPGSRQFFLPIDPRSGAPLFDDHLHERQPVRIMAEAHAGKRLYGGLHPVGDRLPAPVFTQGAPAKVSDTPDSTFILAVDAEGRTELVLPASGVIHLRTDTTRQVGYSLFTMKDSYPNVRTGVDMLKPLRYITSMQEFDRMGGSGDVRKAVEQFWLDAAADRDRARDAIRAYYTRVENANRHFTAHVEGWKTDRGLVHIIFGTPNLIQKNERSETWTYGDESSIMSLSFTFVKRDAIYTDNDMVLERQPTYKGAWYRNVESWRNGRVYQN